MRSHCLDTSWINIYICSILEYIRSNQKIHHYNISVVPPLSYRSNNIVTNDASVVFRLDNKKTYNITIDSILCTNKVPTYNFNIGKKFWS